MIEPLRLSYDIECSAAHAFHIWTSRFSTWWPQNHSTSGDPRTEITFEPRLGGRIFERTSTGLEIDWGEVTGWDPPQRLAYLWHIRRDRAEATDVELTFVVTSAHRCRLVILHTGWERLGADGETWRDANTNGWRGLAPHFMAACTTEHHTHPINSKEH